MGKLIVHEIVSNFDTIIVMKNPCMEFAKWGRPAPSTIAEIADATWKFSVRKTIERVKKGRIIDPASAWLNEPVVYNKRFAVENMIPPDNGGQSSAGIVLQQSSKAIEQIIFGAAPANAKQEIAMPKVVKLEESGNSDGPANTVEINAQEVEPVPKVIIKPIEEEGIRFRVCAGNLMSASPWFNRVLKRNGWMESNWNPEDRCFCISAEDWDEQAFVILMNIFHLRNRKVPRIVTLEMLAKIAILTDYYECGESIELFTDVWVARVRARTPIPTTYCRNLILWIWISWAFRLSDLFKQTTAVAIKQCTEPVRNLGLPIPAWITDEIDLRRYRAIESIMSGLYKQLDLYRSATYSCPISTSYSFQCGCMLLGTLTKEMDSANLLSPRPNIPFFGQSFDAICDKVRLMKSKTWFHSSYNQHECNASTAVNSIVDLAVAGMEGLGLRESLLRMEA